MTLTLNEPTLLKNVILNVNGRICKSEIPSNTTLAEFLIIHLDLTGTKLGCNRAMCGSCTVIMDGVPVFSCTSLAVEAQGRKIQTIEGLEKNGELHPIQQAFIDEDAVQCGICIPGMIMSVKALLDTDLNPNETEVKNAIAGNLCRCGTYLNTIRAAVAAAKIMGNTNV
jgi:aerobic-type carbon monoxide dehydrogenase small subunit (CoxS/CutS family)